MLRFKTKGHSQVVVDVELLFEGAGKLWPLDVCVVVEVCAGLDAAALGADVLGAEVPADVLGADVLGADVLDAGVLGAGRVFGAGVLGAGRVFGAGVLGAGRLGADEAGADEEKYDPVGLLDVVGAGLEGRGVEGGEERTTWDLEPGTLIDKGFEFPYAPPTVGWLSGGLSVGEVATTVVSAACEFGAAAYVADGC